MKASELRLNNWVLQDGLPTQITGYMFHAEFEGLYEIEDEFEPIPLTPEILEAAGFDGGELSIKGAVKQASLSTDDSGMVSLWVEGYYKFGNAKYLHQLQNLYFALTGEELQIKL